MRRPLRALLLLLGVSVFITDCSLLVRDDLADLRCSPDGAIGLPGCNPGQICATFHCRACVSVEVCNDGVDNDCDGRRDEDCQNSDAGVAGAPGAGGADGIQQGHL